MRRHLTTLLLLVLIFWMGRTIVRLESFHYAAVVGFCEDLPVFHSGARTLINDRHTCLHATETRTSALWHLYYALSDPY